LAVFFILPVITRVVSPTFSAPPAIVSVTAAAVLLVLADVLAMTLRAFSLTPVIDATVFTGRFVSWRNALEAMFLAFLFTRRARLSSLRVMAFALLLISNASSRRLVRAAFC